MHSPRYRSIVLQPSPAVSPTGYQVTLSPRQGDLFCHTGHKETPAIAAAAGCLVLMDNVYPNVKLLRQITSALRLLYKVPLRWVWFWNQLVADVLGTFGLPPKYCAAEKVAQLETAIRELQAGEAAKNQEISDLKAKLQACSEQLAGLAQDQVTPLKQQLATLLCEVGQMCRVYNRYQGSLVTVGAGVPHTELDWDKPLTPEIVFALDSEQLKELQRSALQQVLQLRADIEQAVGPATEAMASQLDHWSSSPIPTGRVSDAGMSEEDMLTSSAANAAFATAHSLMRSSSWPSLMPLHRAEGEQQAGPSREQWTPPCRTSTAGQEGHEPSDSDYLSSSPGQPRALSELWRHAPKTPLQLRRARNLWTPPALPEPDPPLGVAANADVPKEFLCPIGLDLILDPVVAPSGVTYNRLCIEKMMREKKCDPASRLPLRSSQLYPNLALRDLIQRWLVDQGCST